ncbi:MAG: hypothetical protein ACKO23_07205, partial [Gemmataceae bacterium]
RFELMYDSGISREGDVLLLAQEDRIVEKKGNWLYYGEVGLGNGSEKAKEFLRENPSVMDEITKRVLEKRKLLGPVEASESEEEEAPPPPPPPPAPTTGRKGRQAASAD